MRTGMHWIYICIGDRDCSYFLLAKFKWVVIVGRPWADGADPAPGDVSQVVGGSLATEGVRAALAQLLSLHGMHVNGLEALVGHPPTQNSGGKWYWKKNVGNNPRRCWYLTTIPCLYLSCPLFFTPFRVWRLPLFNEINGFMWSAELAAKFWIALDCGLLIFRGGLNSVRIFS